MMGFAAGFNAGFSSVMQALREREAQKQRDELAAIANENPEQVDGFTPQQGAAINKAASNAEITNYNPEQKTYTVVPKMPEGEFGPAAPQTFAQQGVTDFLGKRTAGDMTPEQADRARMVAMTGVISKTDPVRALSMRQSMAQEDRQAKMDDRQQVQWGREDNAYNRDQDYIKGREELMKNNPITLANNAYEDELAKHQEAAKAWQEGGQQGPAPTAPVRKMPTPAEQLSSWLPLMQHDYKHGKLSTEGALNFQQQIKKLDDENYTRAIMAAHNGADAATVTKLFNQAGTKIPEGSLVIAEGKDQAGMPVKIMTYTDPQTGQTMTINTGAEAAMLGKLRDFHNDFFAWKADMRGDAQLVLSQNADKRGDKALNIQQSTANMSNALHGEQLNSIKQQNSDRVALSGIRSALSEAISNGDTKQESTLRKQLMAYGTGIKGANNLSPEERRAMFYLASGAAKDETEAARMSHEKVQSSPKDDYMALMKPNNMGMIPKSEDVEPIMSAMHGADWKSKLGGMKSTSKNINTDPAAIAIKNDPKLSTPEKKAKLEALGYK